MGKEFLDESLKINKYNKLLKSKVSYIVTIIALLAINYLLAYSYGIYGAFGVLIAEIPLILYYIKNKKFDPFLLLLTFSLLGLFSSTSNLFQSLHTIL